MRKRLLAIMLTATICLGWIGCAPNHIIDGT